MKLVRASSVRAADDEEEEEDYPSLYTDEDYEELEEAFESTRAEEDDDEDDFYGSFYTNEDYEEFEQAFENYQLNLEFASLQILDLHTDQPVTTLYFLHRDKEYV